MQNFKDFFVQQNESDKQWLVIGKGPSFRRMRLEEVSNYHSISLNHVIKEVAVLIAHIIDIDVLQGCSDAIYKNAKYLMLPLYPHVENKATSKSLESFFSEYPILKLMDDEERLLWYNSTTSRLWDQNYPLIPVRFFSADAVVSLLAYTGVKEIKTIGIDGGKKYSDTFSSLNKKTLLSNSRESFECQFLAIAKTLKKTGAKMLPIDFCEPIKVYVGSEREQGIAVKVLEYSIKKVASCSVDVFPMHLSSIDIPTPKDKKNKPRTSFSFQRFMIPELNGYSGKAIYLDSDMQVFFDIVDLWDRDLSDADVFSTWLDNESTRLPQFSVMLMDCNKLTWSVGDIVKGLDDGLYSYEQLMAEMIVAKCEPAIEPSWNSLESYKSGETKLLHYTDMNTQPWLSRKNPLRDIWVGDLKGAIADGFVEEREIVDSILKGEIRPSIYFELHEGRYVAGLRWLLSGLVDRFFIPPHKLLNGKKKDKNIYRLFRRFFCFFIT